MKIPGRQDLLPLVGLALAIIVLFSTPLSRVFSYARQAEERTGLAVGPALAVLAATLAYYILRRRAAEQTEAAVADIRKLEADQRVEEVERLVGFGQALGRS